MTKAVFFDLDGTLTDSGEGIMKCAELTLTHFGLPIPDAQTMRTIIGPPLEQSFLRLGVPADRIDEAIRVYRGRYMKEGKFENFPYPGIEDVLKQLQQLGYSLYVATSKPEAVSIEILEHFGLAKYFEIIAGALSDRTRRTKSEVIEYLLSQIPDAQDPVMVGDTVYDVIGAKAHGIKTIGVSWGYGDVEQMREAGAVAIANTMPQLLDLIRQEVRL